MCLDHERDGQRIPGQQPEGRYSYISSCKRETKLTLMPCNSTKDTLIMLFTEEQYVNAPIPVTRLYIFRDQCKYIVSDRLDRQSCPFSYGPWFTSRRNQNLALVTGLQCNLEKGLCISASRNLLTGMGPGSWIPWSPVITNAV